MSRPTSNRPPKQRRSGQASRPSTKGGRSLLRPTGRRPPKQGPVSCRLLSGYEGLLSAKKVILGNYAFHVVYLDYGVGATPYVAYASYPRGVNPLSSS